jgi:WD40 repeat protein
MWYQGMVGGRLRRSVRVTTFSFLFLGLALLTLLAQDQQKRESPHKTVPQAPPAAPTGPERGAMVHFNLDRTLKTPVQPIRGLAFGGEHSLAALGNDGNVRVWNAATGELLRTIALADRPKSVSCIAFSPDGKWMVIGEAFTKAEIFTGKVELLDAVAGQEVRALATHHWEVESVAFNRDGHWLASSNWDRKVRMMEFPSGIQVREFESASKPRCVAISPDSKVIASGGTDFTVSLWDREGGKELQRLTGHSGSISAVSFSPDGQRLASASGDGSTRIWNALTGQSLYTLSGHVGAVLSAVYSPDGKFVVSGGADDTVRFWDAATGQNLETLGAHSSVWQVAFTSDGKYLAAGYADGTINIWKEQD